MAQHHTLDTGNLKPLEDWLGARLGAKRVTTRKAELLGGGAIGENWRLDVIVEGGSKSGPHRWVLRTDARRPLGVSLGRAQEFACLTVAHGAGVCVPEPIGECSDASLIGAPFMIAGLADGTAQARQIVRDPAIGEFGPALARRLGEELARLHRIKPPCPALSFMPAPEAPARERVALLRRQLDTLLEPRPVLEYILAWLDRNAPPSGGITLCHGDYRTGNYMVEGGKLTAILDWEFAHWGDPHEDIGWFCARCWRFGADEREAGGIAGRVSFYNGYNELAEVTLDPSRVPYWEVMAAARWATIALLQGERHIQGDQSLELLLTGLMAPEMEYDALAGIRMIEGG